MATVASTCEECDGKGFQPSVLGYRLGGRNISEVLAMSVTEAQAFFGAGEARTPAARAVLNRLADVGLGYLSLGQPLPTLSGGERQRLKLAGQMAEKGDVYILDEPTTGLHLADVAQLLGLLDRLVDSGKSVIVIEHHLAVMAHADWIIDLGPGAGHDGGRIVFAGTPADLVAARSTLTGQHLAAYVGDCAPGGRRRAAAHCRRPRPRRSLPAVDGAGMRKGPGPGRGAPEAAAADDRRATLGGRGPHLMAEAPTNRQLRPEAPTSEGLGGWRRLRGPGGRDPRRLPTGAGNARRFAASGLGGVGSGPRQPGAQAEAPADPASCIRGRGSCPPPAEGRPHLVHRGSACRPCRFQTSRHRAPSRTRPRRLQPMAAVPAPVPPPRCHRPAARRCSGRRPPSRRGSAPATCALPTTCPTRRGRLPASGHGPRRSGRRAGGGSSR